MQIRPEKTSDIYPIYMLNQVAFGGVGESRLVDLLRDRSKLSLSLVADFNNEIVGHIAFSPVIIEKDRKTIAHGIGLAPVSVLPDYQKQGIGSALIYEGIRQCREREVGFIVVLGEPEYYSRFGFMPASNYRLVDEYGGGDAFQIMLLDQTTMPDSGGLVKYASEFGELDV